MFDEKEQRRCWEIEPKLTQCTNMFVTGAVKLKDKMLFCKNCIFYQLANEATNVESNIRFHNFS